MRVTASLATLLLLAGCATVTPIAPTVAPSLVTTAPPQPTPAVSAAPTDAPPTQAPPTEAPPTQAPPSSPTDTAAPPSPAGSPPSGGGERIQVGDYQYVTLTQAEWSETGFSEFFPPDEGNVAYAFLLEFEGLDPDGSSYNPLYFKLIVDTAEFDTNFLGGKEPKLGADELLPGATTSGWIEFEAPLADSVLLRYEPVLGMIGETVEWTVTIN